MNGPWRFMLMSSLEITGFTRSNILGVETNE